MVAGLVVSIIILLDAFNENKTVENTPTYMPRVQ